MLRRSLCLLAFLAPATLAHDLDASPLRGSYVWREQSLVATDEGPPRLLFLNRCPDGCVIVPGAEDAIGNRSTIVQATSSLAPFPFDDQVWQDVVACVRDQYSRFNLNVTDQDPGDVPHFEAIVAGRASDIGADGSLGIAPWSCIPWPNSINFSFAEDIGGSAQALCEVVAQESGHVMGLEHALLCEDPMTYLSGCGAKTFQDQDAECGESVPRPCGCDSVTQNSVQHLLGVFGPGGQPATADVTILEVREDPSHSDGDGVLAPDENALISVSLTNQGNEPASIVAVELDGDGLTLSVPIDPMEIAPGRRAELLLVAEVAPSACGRDVTFTVTARSEGDSWTATSALTAGVAASTWTEDFASDAGWAPGSHDSVVQGGWQFGVPAVTYFAGRVLQPGGGAGGATDTAWFTGLDGAWDESSVVGTTTLVSSPLQLDGWHAVTGLRYLLWYVAWDRTGGALDPSPDAHLIVELSSDGGATWTEIDRVSGVEQRWETREVTVEPVELADPPLVRFTVTNGSTVAERLVEVGIDNVTLVGGELLCTPPTPSSGCSSSSGGAPACLAFFVLVLALGNRRRAGGRRTRPCSAP